MKLLHVIDRISLKMGGPPQVCAALLDGLSETCDCKIAYYQEDDQVEKIAFRDSIQHVPIRPGRKLPHALLGSESTKLLRDAIETVDVVHIHNVWEPVILAAAKISHKAKIPYVVTPHGMLDPWSLSQKSWKKKLALQLGRRWMLENAKFIHVLNSQEEAGIRKLGIKNRCKIVPNGVTLNSIDPHLDASDAMEKFPSLKGRPFALFLSRLHFKKGLDILADASNKFFETHPDWQLVVAGPDDGMEEKFRNQIETMGIGDRVLMTGPIYGSLKYSLLSACEFFCLPSRQEGFSVAILEALAASKPVVITTDCHFNEVGEVGAGFVTSLDSGEIADRFGQLAQSKETRRSMGRIARSLVEEKYTWSAVVEMLQELYESN